MAADIGELAKNKKGGRPLPLAVALFRTWI